MPESISLNDTWQLTWAEGSPLVTPGQFTGLTVEGRGMLPAAVPAPIHKVLMDLGLLDDPNFGLNSLKARWVEEQFWVYRYEFAAPEGAVGAAAWLALDKIDSIATVWLNGELLGKHESAHRPARFPITGKMHMRQDEGGLTAVRSGRLKAEGNVLVVQVETGLHAAADKPGAEYQCAQMELLTKRHWFRKPQYQSGWDWNARLMNVGILGDVRLEWARIARMDDLSVLATVSDDLAAATVHVGATVEVVGKKLPEGAQGVLSVRIVETDHTADVIFPLEVGESRQQVSVAIADPQLWWPIHHGEQFRYTVEITLKCGEETQTETRKLGIRRVEIDQSPHPVEGQHFILKVNNRPVFCKGGNWVPADLMYSTVTPERYRELVDLAVGANFNMLRIWGGGLFTDHALCDACDEKGVLIWHDFLFACCKYPGDDPEFAAEVRREVTWAVRDLAHHASLVVWCGNNEIEWGDWAWGYDGQTRTHPHYALFHHDMPKIVHDEDPSKVYWISSPYSPDFKAPNDPTVGDQHPWGVSIINPGPPDFWQYREFVDRFPNEGGVLGASSPATLRQFLPEGQQHLLSPSWEHHDNPINVNTPEQGQKGRCYQGVELWLGYDPLGCASPPCPPLPSGEGGTAVLPSPGGRGAGGEAMLLDDYAFVSGLLQSEGLQEYIANYRRRMYSSASAIFWMYNDSWPVTHGWTIVDYYRRKKLSYHPVRRAFQPIAVVVVDEGDQVSVYGVNDTPNEWEGHLCYGIFTLAGGMPLAKEFDVRLPANSSKLQVQFSREEWEAAGFTKSGCFAVLSQSGEFVAQHRIFCARFGELEFAADPGISLRREGEMLYLKAEKFAWGVCLDIDGELPLADNCFDLIPGGEYPVPWPAELGEAKVVRVGNGVR